MRTTHGVFRTKASLPFITIVSRHSTSEGRGRAVMCWIIIHRTTIPHDFRASAAAAAESNRGPR